MARCRNFDRKLGNSKPLSYDRQHLSYDVWLEVRGEIITYQNCSVLYCVRKLCTVISTLRWVVLTVLWIGFCHIGPISLYVNWFICVYLCVFCVFVSYCIAVVLLWAHWWAWWDWSLILGTCLPSVLWHCWLGHMTRKNPSQIWPIMCYVRR